MNKKYFLYLLFLSFLSGNIIIHERLDSAPYGLPVPIKAFLEISESDVYRFSLLYRSAGNIEFIETPMTQIGRSFYQAEIPREFCRREFLEYYLLLDMNHHTLTKYPSIDADKKPIRIQIDIPEDASILEEEILSNTEEIDKYNIVSLEADYIILSPKPGERTHRHNLFIALSYFRMKNIDPSQIKVYLDEIDVSDRANIDSTYMILPVNAILPGIHTVKVNITNVIGQKYNNISWNFTILPGEIQSFGTIKKQSSRVRANYNGRGLSSEVLNIGEIEYHHEVEFDWLQLEAQYLKSSLDNQYVQPYDRYSLKLKNEFLNIKFGDSYPYIDNYAWNGRRVRGVNFLFTKNPISFEMINGKTARAIQGDPEKNAMVISAIDSTTDNWEITVSRDNYTFQQDVSAAKIGLDFKKTKFNIYYIKVQDNIPTVSNKILNSKIVIPNELVSRIQPSNDFTISDTVYSIRFDSLQNNFTKNFSENDILYLDSINWIGYKPEDNYIFGSNLQFGFDDSRILISSGFSFSFFNRNKWNLIQNINELDTLEYDSTSQLDEYFIETLLLDSSFSISNYENYISFGQDGQPLIPFIMKQSSTSLSDFINLSNLNRYSTLQLRYLGHRVELGSKRNGPDYYSILNPALKTNYKETYFSDRFSIFKNKLLFYFKKSKVTEGLYIEIPNPIETRKSIFNISLYPGSGLPTFNFGFHQSNRDNGVETYKMVTDTLLSDNEEIIITQIIDNRININFKQFNISMTNQFKLWISQVLSLNILLSEQNDQFAKNINVDTIKPVGYLPKDALSQSYAINLKSIYNNHWDSNLYFNTSHYDYGQNGFDYDDDGIYDDDHKQELYNYQFRLGYRPEKFFKKFLYGMYYSTGRGTTYYTQYNFNLKITSEPIEGLYLNMLFDYRIKYLGGESKSPNDLLFRAQILYNIL